MQRLSAFALLLTAMACGQAAVSEGSHPAFPQVHDFGGPVLGHPTLVAVTFDQADPSTPIVNDFVAQLPSSSYWATIAEYRIGSATAGVPIPSSLQLDSTVDDSFWQSSLPTLIQNSQNGFSFPPPSDAIYVLFLPASVTATVGTFVGSNPVVVQGCVNFGGYHSSVRLDDGTQIAYAIIPNCGSRGFNGLRGSDSLTGVASHEIAETATDPFFNLNQGAFADVDDVAFSLAFGGGEIGDLCIQTGGDAFFQPSDLPFTVQRLWSNVAASNGDDPCQPASTAGPFVQSIPRLPQNLPLKLKGAIGDTKGVSIAVGQSATIVVDLYSPDPSAGPWQLDTRPLGDGLVLATFDQTSGMSGDHVNLTLTVSSAGTLAGLANVEGVVISSTLDGREQLWPILINSP